MAYFRVGKKKNLAERTLLLLLYMNSRTLLLSNSTACMLVSTDVKKQTSHDEESERHFGLIRENPGAAG